MPANGYDGRVGKGETYRSTILYACVLSGGEAKLAERLGVGVEEVVRWAFGEVEPPLAAFLAAVDIVLAARAGTLAETKKMLRASKQMLERTRERQQRHRRGKGKTRPLRVLVVDDEPDTVETLAALLRADGHAVVGVSDAHKALAAAIELRAEVAILDVAMPGLSGLDLAKDIRRAMGEQSPLLVALSGQYTRDDDKALARAAGFEHYFYKPCDPKVLLTLLARHAASSA